MLTDIFTIEKDFQPFLLKRDYTFIGPVQPNLLKDFINVATKFAPIVSISRSVHHVLSHKQSIEKTLSLLGIEIPLRIYVVTYNNKQLLKYSDIENYCIQNNIIYPIK